MKKYFQFFFLFAFFTAFAQDPVKSQQIKEAQEREEQERIKESLREEKPGDIQELEEAKRKRDSTNTTITVIDSLYREDQFYIGLTYNLLQKRPKGVSQNSFSSGLSLLILISL